METVTMDFATILLCVNMKAVSVQKIIHLLTRQPVLLHVSLPVRGVSLFVYTPSSFPMAFDNAKYVFNTCHSFYAKSLTKE